MTTQGCSKSASGSNTGLAREKRNERRRTPDRERGRCTPRSRDTLGRDPGTRLPRPRRGPRCGQGLGVAGSRARSGAGARCRPRRPARRAEGRAGRGQGRDRHLRHADPARLADLSRQPPLCRRRLRRADPDGGRRHPRQDGDNRIRQPPPARDRASAQPGTYARGLVERLGGGGRRLPGAGRVRDPDRRLDDPPGRVLRRGRLQALLWRVQPGRHQDAVPQPRHPGHHLPQPRRYFADARGVAGAAPPRGRPRRRRSSHRLLPHALLGPRQLRHPGIARTYRCPALGRRRHRQGNGTRPGRLPRPPASGLRVRGGAQLRLRIRGARRPDESGSARRAVERRPRPAAVGLCRGDRDRRGGPRSARQRFRRVRRIADAECGRRGPGRARHDRRRALQRDLDIGVDAVRDPAGRHRKKGSAARHPARRPTLSRRGPDRRRRLGRGPARLNRGTCRARPPAAFSARRPRPHTEEKPK